MAALDDIRALLPGGVPVANWRQLSPIEIEDLCSRIYGHYAEFDEDRDAYLTAERRLTSAYSLVSHLDGVAPYADEVAFYQMIRGQLKKTVPGLQTEAERQKKMGALIDRSIASQGMVDIFEVAGIPNPDVSVLDPRFLEEFRSRTTQQENLRVKLLEKLLADEIVARQRKNLKKYRTFKEMLDGTLKRYHNNAITAAVVIQRMMEIRQQMVEEDERKRATGLSDEELAFYDALAGLGEQAYDMAFLCDLVREVVQAVKRNLKVDWTKPHREDVKAAVMASVKMVLRRHKVKKEHFDFILKRVEEQAVALYEDWPLVA